MRPLDLQIIGNELAIKWEDGSEQFILLERLRRACPCAACKGEVDIMGNLHIGPSANLSPQAFQVNRILPVGGYGIQPLWADGHSSGIFTFDSLLRARPN